VAVRGLERARPALQNVIIAGLVLILAHLPSRDWEVGDPRVDRAPLSDRAADDLPT
jgi:hypothetical protein